MKPLPPASLLAAFGLVLGIVALAGFVDAYAYGHFQGLFVSFMSGNTTSLGVAVAHGDHPKLRELLGVLGLFVGGVVLGALLGQRAGRGATPAILGAVAALLLLAHLRPALAVGALTLGMGVLNAAVHEVGGVKVSLTFVTGTLVRFGTGLAGLLSGQRTSWDWLWQATLWLGFLAGALAGGGVLVQRPAAALPAAAAGALALAVAARRVRGTQ
ncbi:YoaK family protein [Hymenobacter nivis]|nr:YoaK family protein [Hymenobacter nivis]